MVKIKHERFKFKNKQEFLKKIQEQNLDIPFSDDIRILFDRAVIQGKTIPNRFAVQPMEGGDGNAEGTPGDLTLRRYLRFAAGGSGLICFEATAVSKGGRSNARQLMLNKKNKDVFGRLVEEMREAAKKSMGSNHDLLVILQLTHAGRYSKPEGKPNSIISCRSLLLDRLQNLPKDYPLIKDEELDRIQEDFVLSAKLAREAGFDGVDIKACHGYLVSELLASFTREHSRYGGSFENRSRFLIETARKIKDCAPGMIVTSRLSVYDAIPYPYGFGVDKKSWEKEDLTEVKMLIKNLISIGYPLLNVSLGNPHYKPHFGRPYDLPMEGGYIPDEHPLIGVSRLLRITGELQHEFKALPIVGTGYSWLRSFFPNVGAAMVKAKKAAIVGLGRGALAYPDFAKDLLEKGTLSRKKVCTACSLCSDLLRKGKPAGCALRDRKVYGTSKNL